MTLAAHSDIALGGELEMPGTRFFRLTSDNYGPTPHPRWQLDIEPTLATGEWWDVWAYSYGRPAEPPPFPFTISPPGPRSELNITTFNAYVVSERVANAIKKSASSEIQLIPVTIEGDSDKWYILNVLSVVDCIDYERSQISSFYPDDFEDATRAGEPRCVVRLVIDASRTGGHQIFRVKGWTVSMIVSESIREKLEETWAIGLRFDLVTP